MQVEWQRIVAWVGSHAPASLDSLEPPAGRADLAEAETRLFMRLPTVLRSFYGLQNGTTAFAAFPALAADQSAFGPLPLDEIEFLDVEDEDDNKPRPNRRRSRDAGEAGEDFDVDPGVRPEFWNPNWIPFAAAADRGDYLMLDFAPARGGRIGQVIEWRHDTNERRVVAPSLEAFLKEIAEGLEAGRYVRDGAAGVRRAEETR